ncbi:MAG TPA: ABC transporter substrate-binding protein [Stellaceae bacterium]|nr:ABC transporter substrate-binding protein [Stellaceae bacterium]
MIRTRTLSRRRVLAGTGAAVASLGFPAVLRAQAQVVKIGILHPVTGALSYSGTQARHGARIRIEEINAAGGIKSLAGAKIEPIYADCESKPDVTTAEVDKLADDGAALILGPYASGLALVSTQAAAKHNMANVVDVGVVDAIVERGLTNTFRFAPGLKKVTSTALENLVKINDAAGKPAKTVFIIHEDSAFGTGMAKLLNDELPKRGFTILGTEAHGTPTRDFTNIVLKVKAADPDLVIPANYYNEYVLFVRTLVQQRVQPKAVYSILGGGASSIKFVHEFNAEAQYVMDCNHWYDPRKPASKALTQKLAAQKIDLTYEVMLNYACMQLIEDALERAASADRQKIIAALAASTLSDHIMPYGPTKFVNGNNEGAQPVNTQIRGESIEVIFPKEFATAEAVFPIPHRA